MSTPAMTASTNAALLDAILGSYDDAMGVLDLIRGARMAIEGSELDKGTGTQAIDTILACAETKLEEILSRQSDATREDAAAMARLEKRVAK